MGKLKDAANKIKPQADSASDDNIIVAAFDQLVPVSAEKSAELRKKLADILENTSNTEISTDKFKQDIVQVFEDPKAEFESIKSRLSLFDKSTLKEIIADSGNFEADKVDKVVDQVFNFMSGMGEKAKGELTKVKVNSDIKSILNTKLEEYLDGLGTPELNYFSLKRDAQSIMDEPGSAPQVIRKRLQKLDKGSLIFLLSSNSNIWQEQATNAADTMIDARDKALETYASIETEVAKRYQHSRMKMVLYAEHVRENAITAAWWLVASALVCATASVGGALLSVCQVRGTDCLNVSECTGRNTGLWLLAQVDIAYPT